MNKDILQKSANESRGLAMDAIEACSSGHLGLPLGAAEIGSVLFGDVLNFNPEDPNWLNRDRFVLSAGHGSMFLYSWLHLSGYDVSLQDLKNFRKLGSKTPGHPEFGETAGVECTTGPLGQGIGNSVGLAMSSKMSAELFNTDEFSVIDNTIICLAGDGCIQEGVSAESASLAGHLGLDNLIIIYDSNDVTLDAMGELSQSENTAKRYEAYGFDVETIDGHSLDAIQAALIKAKANRNGKPTLIEAKTIIGKGISEVEGTAKGHGEGGAKFVDDAHERLGLPKERFSVSDEVRNFFSDRKSALLGKYNEWSQGFATWSEANSDKAALLAVASKQLSFEDYVAKVSFFADDSKLATRVAGEKVLNDLADAFPLIISGSADLHGSTKNYIKCSGDFLKGNYANRNIRYGIREHAMGAILNGFAYDGIFKASGATFAMFADYMRPSVRIAALAKLPVFYIWTHDSIGVGEDGPTHQPVEMTSSLRCIPNFDVVRPADPEETAGAYAAALSRTDGPTGIILSRQSLPTLSNISVDDRREGVQKGGYVALKETSALELIILATGSELQHAIKAAGNLGSSVRVVSMPCMERFDRQPSDYRESVLPASCRKRVSIEAGITTLWTRYVGLDGKSIGTDDFGISAPGDIVMEKFGITSENVEVVAKSLLAS
mgnify:CR=1 FL=1